MFVISLGEGHTSCRYLAPASLVELLIVSPVRREVRNGSGEVLYWAELRTRFRNGKLTGPPDQSPWIGGGLRFAVPGR